MALPTADCLRLILQLLTPVIEAHDDNNESLTAREVGVPAHAARVDMHHESNESLTA